MASITRAQPITVDEYDRMVADGTIAEDDRVELRDGVVVPEMPRNPRHPVGTRKAVKALAAIVPDGWFVAREDGLVIGPSSKPEPDVAVIRSELEFDSTRNATAADCCLVIESLADNRGKKLAGYARAGIPAFWIVNVKLVPGQVEVYTDPDPAAGAYAVRTDYRPRQDVPVLIDGQVVGRIPVAEVLP
jgi:Uma2 family endonuclease